MLFGGGEKGVNHNDLFHLLLFLIPPPLSKYSGLLVDILSILEFTTGGTKKLVLATHYYTTSNLSAIY